MIYTSPQFHLHYIGKYQLIVKANYKHDVLYVVDEDQQLLAYMKYESQYPPEEALKLLSLPFQQVFVSIPHSNLTFIPNDLYQVDDVERYQDFMDSPRAWAETETLGYLQTQAFYQYDVLLEQRWRSLFPQAKFIPEFKLNLTQARPHIPLQGEVLGVVFNEGQVDLFLFINGQFKFYNQFEVLNEDDLSYFILNLFQVFGLSGKVTKVLLSTHDSTNPLISKLGDFAKEVVEIKASQGLKHSEDLPLEISENYLTELPTCAL